MTDKQLIEIEQNANAATLAVPKLAQTARCTIAAFALWCVRA